MRLSTLAMLTAALMAGCGSDRADRTQRFRNLSQPELAEIHARFDELKRKGAPLNLRSQQIPAVVARLDPVGVTIRGDSAWIHVDGVFDDKVYVFVNGIGESRADKEIILSAGERQPPEVLWRQPR